MKTEVIKITPKDALLMLEGNKHNRRLNKIHVKKLAAAMKRGEWQLNGESIKLNGDLILDGQHRLYACVEANTAFTTVVAKGLPKKVQQTIDTGKGRTAANHLQMIGEPYAGHLATAITRVLEYDAQQRLTHNGGLSNIQVETFLNENPDIREYMQFYGPRMKQIIGPASLATACHFIFARIDEADAEKFMTSYVDGAGLEKGSPILTLRNRLIRDLASESRLAVWQKFGMFIKAWNFYRKGESNTRLQFVQRGANKEAFPRAV
jgi:hypothetical protein